MHEFFRPFRRKLGVGGLCMALWLRSFDVADVIQFQTDKIGGEVSRIKMMSAGRGVYWQQIVGNLDPRPKIEWVSVDVAGFDANRDLYCRWEWKFDYVGSQIEEGRYGPPPSFSAGRIRTWIVPYWLIVMPMTMFSAWRLVSKTRPSLRNLNDA